MSLSHAGVNLNVKYFPPTQGGVDDISGTLQQLLRIGYSLQNADDDILLKLDKLETCCGGDGSGEGFDEIITRLDGLLQAEERNHNQVMTKLDSVLAMGPGGGSGEPQPCETIHKSNFLITDLVEHREKLSVLEGMVDYIRQDVMDYHDLFEELYRASEIVRIQQKKGFKAQLIEITEIHRKEIETIKLDMRKALHVVPAEISIEPADAPVQEALEPYIRESILTGKPLYELLPPSLLVTRLHYFSSGSSTNASSSNSSGKLTSSASNSSSSSSSSGSESKFISTTSVTQESADSPATSTSASSGDETGLPRIIQAGSSSATTMSEESEDSPYTSSSSSSASSDRDPVRVYSSSSSSSSGTVESLDSLETSTSESSGDENHLDRMILPGSSSATTMSVESTDSPWTSSSSENPDSDVPPEN